MFESAGPHGIGPTQHGWCAKNVDRQPCSPTTNIEWHGFARSLLPPGLQRNTLSLGHIWTYVSKPESDEFFSITLSSWGLHNGIILSKLSLPLLTPGGFLERCAISASMVS